MPKRSLHAALSLLFLALAGMVLPWTTADAQYSAPSVYERHGDRLVDRAAGEDYDDDLDDTDYYNDVLHHDRRLSRYEDYPPGYHWFYRPYLRPHSDDRFNDTRHRGDPYLRRDARDDRPPGPKPAPTGLSERERIIRLLRIPLPEPRGGRAVVRAQPAPAKRPEQAAPSAPAPIEKAVQPASPPVASAETSKAPAAEPRDTGDTGQNAVQPPESRRNAAGGAPGVTIAAKAQASEPEQRINTTGKADPIRPPAIAATNPPEIAALPGEAAAAAGRPRSLPNDELTRMIGQMILTGFDGRTASDKDVVDLQGLITAGHIGGFVLTERNIASPEQVKALISALRRAKSQHLVLAAIAQDGGEASPLAAAKGFTRYPSAGELGRIGDPLKAHETYAGMASELHALGFNVNIGPVADVSSGNPPGPATFGSDPRHVTAFVKAFAVAHRDAGLFTVVKHFPGGANKDALEHGRLDDALLPYRELAKERFSDMVMVGHARHAHISQPLDRPAAISPKAVQDLLRSRLGYEGVTIAADIDSSHLDGVASLEDRVVMAIEAGNDMVFIAAPAPGTAADTVLRIIGAVRDAVASGRLSQARIRTSFDRVRTLKRRLDKLQASLRAASVHQSAPREGSASLSRQ